MYTVILVDDEYMIQRSICKMIEADDAFIVVGEAEDGQEALELYDLCCPDIVITDINMPIIDGLELIGEIRSRGRKTEIIVISGYSDFMYAQQALRYGVTDYLLKPITPEAIKQVMERIDHKLRTENEEELVRREWLWICKARGEQLVEQMWQLNEAFIAVELKDIDDLWREKGWDLNRMGEFYQDLLTFIRGEIMERNTDEAVLEGIPSTYGSGLNSEQLYSVLVEIMAYIRSTRNWGTHHNIRSAVEYMDEHYTQSNLSLRKVAEAVGMSGSYLSRTFKEDMGISFIQYLTKLRMNEAKKLLLEPNCKTYEVAYKIGYMDYPHFTKAFKKYNSLSPSEYRKSMGVQ